MEFQVGNKVKYYFPNPNSADKRVFTGIIDFIGETFITIRNESNTQLRVTSKNFYLLENHTPNFDLAYSESENYYG